LGCTLCAGQANAGRQQRDTSRCRRLCTALTLPALSSPVSRLLGLVVFKCGQVPLLNASMTDEDWEIEGDELRTEGMIGQGSFGLIFR
jgi:hypothetical protein